MAVCSIEYGQGREHAIGRECEDGAVAALTSPQRVVNESWTARACGAIQIAIAPLCQRANISAIGSVERGQRCQRAIGCHFEDRAVGGVDKFTVTVNSGPPKLLAP